MKRKWLLVSGALATLLVGSWFFFFRNADGDAKATPAGVVKRSAKVARQPIKVQVTATGQIQPIYKVDIKSKASGEVLSLKLNEGDFVKKGSIIALIEKTDALAAYNQAKADLEVAKATLKQAETNNARSRKLYEQRLISEQEMDASNLELEQRKAQLIRAQATFDQAQIRLNDCVVRSPIDGIVLDKPVDEGQVIMGGLNTVSGGTTIATIADMSRVYVHANIDEVDVGKIKIGQEAEIVADAYPDEKFVGKVLRIDPLAKVEQNVTRFPVVIEAPNPNFRLLAGMNATVTVTVYDNPNALVVPVEALKEAKDLGGDLAERGAMRLGERGAFRGNAPDSVREQRRKRFQERLAAGDSSAMRWSEERAKAKRRFVMLKDSTGAVAPRPVLIGEQTAEYAEVLRGLNEGDEVEITLFSRALMEGQQFQERMRANAGFGQPSREQRRELRRN
ncbi:MAG: efflux RND transporter periplasmic adaptor subunit [Chloroherpetonaceae bacterium]|nr:efflux RND transporter periplasmic adaptor subunit [Chloroherpetonaceae bacterium]MDW8437702.1 efflux RND transporter periplasmic adaptor subunit [Chloroherpetonaceae bacterium]